MLVLKNVKLYGRQLHLEAQRRPSSRQSATPRLNESQEVICIDDDVLDIPNSDKKTESVRPLSSFVPKSRNSSSDRKSNSTSPHHRAKNGRESGECDESDSSSLSDAG